MRRFPSIIRNSLILAAAAGVCLASGSGTVAIASESVDPGSPEQMGAPTSVEGLLPQVIVTADRAPSTALFAFDAYRR